MFVLHDVSKFMLIFSCPLSLLTTCIILNNIANLRQRLLLCNFKHTHNLVINLAWISTNIVPNNDDHPISYKINMSQSVTYLTKCLITSVFSKIRFCVTEKSHQAPLWVKSFNGWDIYEFVSKEYIDKRNMCDNL